MPPNFAEGQKTVRPENHDSLAGAQFLSPAQAERRRSPRCHRVFGEGGGGREYN